MGSFCVIFFIPFSKCFIICLYLKIKTLLTSEVYTVMTLGVTKFSRSYYAS
jgi:hypothetical protein